MTRTITAPVTPVRISALGANNAETATGLVSTGADTTSIEEKLAKRLGVADGKSGAKGRAWIEIEGLDWPRRRIEVDVRAHNRGHEVVIGRDLLASLVLRYGGSTGRMELSLETTAQKRPTG